MTGAGGEGGWGSEILRMSFLELCMPLGRHFLILCIFLGYEFHVMATYAFY